MSKPRSGGSRKWCPACEQHSVCKATSKGRWHNTKRQNIQFFRRELECLQCGYKWLTAEVEEAFIDDIVNYHSLLAELKSIKLQASTCSRSIKNASKNLSLFLNEINDATTLG